MKAIRFHESGGPEVLKLEEIPAPPMQPGETRVRVTWAGINYTDIYQRTGFTAVRLPFTPGSEGAGIVEASDDETLRPGTRVVWAGHPGACAELASIPTWKLVPIPEGVSERDAAAVLLQGITAQYLSETTYVARRGDTALVHAGAGGVGLLLTQILKRKGVTVFATVSTPEKAALAREAGADHTILYTSEDFVEAVRKATGGRGVHVAYDSVGKATWSGSLSLVRPLGTVVFYGQASGAVPPIDPLLLSKQGSIFMTRPAIGHYIADRAALLERASKVLGWVADGSLKLRIDRVYPLAETAQAHRDLESRATTGKLLISVDSKAEVKR